MLAAVLTYISHALPQQRGNLLLLAFFSPSLWFSFAQQNAVMVQLWRKHGSGYKKKVGWGGFFCGEQEVAGGEYWFFLGFFFIFFLRGNCGSFLI